MQISVKAVLVKLVRQGLVYRGVPTESTRLPISRNAWVDVFKRTIGIPWETRRFTVWRFTHVLLSLGAMCLQFIVILYVIVIYTHEERKPVTYLELSNESCPFASWKWYLVVSRMQDWEILTSSTYKFTSLYLSWMLMIVCRFSKMKSMGVFSDLL